MMRVSEPPPVFFATTGIRRAPGTKSERKRSQSRGWPAGPEITSYVAAMIASGDETSAGFAAGGVVAAWAAAGAAAVFDSRAEHAALEPAPGQFGEEALDGVEPGARGRRVVEHEARMPAEP